MKKYLIKNLNKNFRIRRKHWSLEKRVSKETEQKPTESLTKLKERETQLEAKLERSEEEFKTQIDNSKKQETELEEDLKKLKQQSSKSTAEAKKKEAQLEEEISKLKT